MPNTLYSAIRFVRYIATITAVEFTIIDLVGNCITVIRQGVLSRFVV